MVVGAGAGSLLAVLEPAELRSWCAGRVVDKATLPPFAPLKGAVLTMVVALAAAEAAAHREEAGATAAAPSSRQARQEAVGPRPRSGGLGNPQLHLRALQRGAPSLGPRAILPSLRRLLGPSTALALSQTEWPRRDCSYVVHACCSSATAL